MQTHRPLLTLLACLVASASGSAVAAPADDAAAVVRSFSAAVTSEKLDEAVALFAAGGIQFNLRPAHPGMGGLYCGFNCTAIYALQDGEVFRISGNTTDCAGDLCTGMNIDPRLGPEDEPDARRRVAEPGGGGGDP